MLQEKSLIRTAFYKKDDTTSFFSVQTYFWKTVIPSVVSYLSSIPQFLSFALTEILSLYRQELKELKFLKTKLASIC